MALRKARPRDGLSHSWTTHVTDSRAQLRDELRSVRRAIPAPQRIAAAQSLARHLLALPVMPATGHVAGYWAMDGEITLHAWQLQLPPGMTYCLPVLGRDKRLRFAAWKPGDPLGSNRFGIPEPQVPASSLLDPEAMALVVVPLVGFDTTGQRLGMGGGWYDRSFAFRSTQAPPPWLVGAGFAAQQCDDLPREPWDIALDAICSERETFITLGIQTGAP
jgi:5-formyltetrahydrofolate cyclo-ligase